MMAPALVGVTDRMSDKEIISHARSLSQRMCCARHLARISDDDFKEIVGYLHTLKPGAATEKGSRTLDRGARGCCCGRGGR